MSFMVNKLSGNRFFARALSLASSELLRPKAEFDVKYICNPGNTREIDENVKLRKGIGDIYKVIECYKSFQHTKEIGGMDLSTLEDNLNKEISLLPNKTHPLVMSYGEEPRLIKFISEKPNFGNSKPFDFSEITRKLNIIRTDHLGNVTGDRSYYFMNELAELEEALIKYTLSRLVDIGYSLVSVPDILPSHIIQSCGMNLQGERHQVYSLDSLHHGPELCLSGTAEMSLAGFLMNTTYKETELPIRLAAVSRCYRAEISNVAEQKGIYRVHQFTKVEMFAVTKPSDSDAMLEEIRDIEETLFANLGLHLRVLDMPPKELGAPAYRKYDIEAWMPGRDGYGEISSCSNCTDYQARRLNIKYLPSDSSISTHVHTLNGTACAIPRMLIALLETHQTADGKINIPVPLRKHFSNREYFTKSKRVPALKLLKGKHDFNKVN